MFCTFRRLRVVAVRGFRCSTVALRRRKARQATETLRKARVVKRPSGKWQVRLLGRAMSRTSTRRGEATRWSTKRSAGNCSMRHCRGTSGHTLADVLRRYRDEGAEGVRRDGAERCAIDALLRRPLAKRSLDDLTAEDMKWRCTATSGSVSRHDPLHCIPMLACKPGGLRSGAPFKEWELPPSMRRVQRRLGRVPPGDRQMVDVLGGFPTDGLEAVEAACAEALGEGVRSAAALDILARRREPAPPLAIATPEVLRLTCGPADCARYDSPSRPGHGKIAGAGRHGSDQALRQWGACPPPVRGPVVVAPSVRARWSTPVKETLVRELAGGDSSAAAQRRADRRHAPAEPISPLPLREPASVAAGGAASQRRGPRQQACADRQGRTADLLCRLDLFAIGSERMATRWLTPRRARLPAVRPDRRTAAVPSHQPPLRAHVNHRPRDPRPRWMARSPLCPNQWRINGSGSVTPRRPRPCSIGLRTPAHRRDRQRELALQDPRLRPGHPPARAASAT